MLKSSILLFMGFVAIISTVQYASADVWIPEHEITSFVGHDGQFTVVGAVKNTESYAVIPEITINLYEGNQIVSKTFEHPLIPASGELPFKIKFSDLTEPKLESYSVNYTPAQDNNIKVDVIYDELLVTHEDGHVTGTIINNGTSSVSNVKVSALVYGEKGKLLDVGQNIELIEKIEPGEIKKFSIYPDPSIASKVKYYSCFAVGDNSIVVLNVKRDNENFLIRYDSGVLYSYPEFDEKEENLSFAIVQGWPLEYYNNFEFPRYADDEKFDVRLNDEPVDFIQSIDEMGNWHVSFKTEPSVAGDLVISGFKEKGKVTPIEQFFEVEKNNYIVQEDDAQYYYLLGIIPIGIAVAVIAYKKKN